MSNKCKDCKYWKPEYKHTDNWGKCSWFIVHDYPLLPSWSYIVSSGNTGGGDMPPDHKGCKVWEDRE